MARIPTIRRTAVSAAFLEGTIARLTTLRWWSGSTNDLPSTMSPTAACPSGARPLMCGKPSTAPGLGARVLVDRGALPAQGSLTGLTRDGRRVSGACRLGNGVLGPTSRMKQIIELLGEDELHKD
jgi:hypothetical protein